MGQRNTYIWGCTIYITGRKKEKKISKRILRKKYKKVVDKGDEVWYYEQAVARNDGRKGHKDLKADKKLCKKS